MSANPLLEMLDVLGGQTAGTFRLSKLSGPRQVWLRSHLMATLRGNKVRSSKCGISALTEAFYAAAGVPKDLCAARQADEFAKWCKAQSERKLTCQNC